MQKVNIGNKQGYVSMSYVIFSCSSFKWSIGILMFKCILKIQFIYGHTILKHAMMLTQFIACLCVITNCLEGASLVHVKKKTFQYMMVKWWSQSSYIIVWKYKLITFFMNKNASCLHDGVCHWKCCCTCFKNSSLLGNQEQSFQNSLNKFKDIWK